jgi:hypothetical protein
MRIEELGHERLLYIALDAATVWVARLAADAALPAIDAPITLSWPADAMHRFDADGRRLDVERA